MDKLGGKTGDLKQKITNLRRQCNEYDSLLKQFSIQYMDLAPSMQKDLDEYAQFKRKFGLYDMDLVFLSEFYCIRTETNIEKTTAIARIKYNNVYFRFREKMRIDFKHVNDIDRVLRNINRQMEDLIQKKMQVGKNVKIDLIAF